MISILSEQGRPVLEGLARERALLVFDYDGTLAPIVSRPDDAQLSPSTAALLRVAALLYPCAVVSGRARSDVAPRLATVPLLAVVGNHGAEAGFGPVDAAPRQAVARWSARLAPALAAVPGVEIEDKGLSIAVHYRRAADRRAARRSIAAAVATLEGARVFAGRAVVNVAPVDAPDKGSAVAELQRRAGAPRALYVGDDVTDEDAFAAGGVAVAVRVGRRHRSAARWYVPSQRHVDALLRALIAARGRLDGRGEDALSLQDAATRATRHATSVVTP